MPNRLALEGQLFGRLKVEAFAGLGKGKNSLWLCRCECGTCKVVYGTHLRSGSTTSCGCRQKERAAQGQYIHGHSGEGKRTREYRSWDNMLQRCFNPNSDNYGRYGGRGITVASEWIDDFIAFYEYMGPRPEGKSLDRWPDNNGNYEPGNVRWATPEEQAFNRRDTNNK